MTLPTFVDDQFTGERKYNQVTNEDGSYSFEDITDYTQIGTEVNAEIMNEIVSEINTNTSSIATNTASIATNTASITEVKDSIKYITQTLTAGETELTFTDEWLDLDTVLCDLYGLYPSESLDSEVSNPLTVTFEAQDEDKVVTLKLQKML